MSKTSRKTTAAQELVFPALVQPTEAPVTDARVYNVNGRKTALEALTVGAQGYCDAEHLFIAPAGHPRHDPRALIDRGAAFYADVDLNGIDQPVAAFLADGKLEVLDGRGRVDAARRASRIVPFIVVRPPSGALAARVRAVALNDIRMETDPLSRAALAQECLDAGWNEAEVAEAFGRPVSAILRLTRIDREADEATKSLLREGTIDESAALTIVQQADVAVRAAIVADVVALATAAAAAPEGKVVDVALSNQPVAKVDKKTGKAKVSRTAVEAARDRAVGKTPSKAQKAPETALDIRTRAEQMAARAFAQENLTDTGRTYLCGVRDALEALFDSQWIVGTAHPHMALANAVLARRSSK